MRRGSHVNGNVFELSTSEELQQQQPRLSPLLPAFSTTLVWAALSAS